MNRTTSKLSALILCVSLFLMGIIFFGCQTKQGVELPFETIEHELATETGANYEGREPDLVIITSVEEADEIDITHHHQAVEITRNLDYTKFFVIGVYQGRKPNGGYLVDIRRITQDGNTITIFTDFTEPGPQDPVTLMETSPRQLVKVPLGNLRGEFNFILVANEKVILQKTHQLEETAYVPFETVEKKQLSDTGEEFTGDDPWVIVISSSDQIAEVANLISIEAQDTLKNLDYTQDMALVVFQGKEVGNVEIEIQKIVRTGKNISIYADIVSNSPDHPAPDNISISPYHIVKIPRVVTGQIQFTLITEYLPTPTPEFVYPAPYPH